MIALTARAPFCPRDGAMQTLRKNKVSLIRTLSTDASFILQYVQQDNIITDREYSELKHKNHTKEDIVINLLDTLMNKGDETCCKFVDLLQREDVQETYPGAQQLFNPAPTSHNQENPVRATDEEDDCYPMTRRPVGHCLIINNHKFEDIALIRNRKGTDIDKDALKEVFERMHFSVEERRDLSSSDILKVLTEFSVKDHSQMDAFVCCILTHGAKGAVLGIDGRPVPIRELTLPLAHCSTLTGKPKLFFIQACQGSNMHESILRQDETEERMKACAPSVIVATPMRGTWTQAMQTLRKNKVCLIRTLSTDSSFILQYVQQDNIITDREYTNLKHNNHTKEDIVINLLDTVMSKGDATCCNFLDLLQREDVQENFPQLRLLFTHTPISHNQENPVRTPSEVCQGTKMQKSLWKHYGTEEDDAEKADLSRIPIEADFLIGMATMESYVSFRNTQKGSIYIQELCKRLKTGCHKKEDILTILTRVNRGVAAQDIKALGKDCFKQMPEPRYTLTNKLVLPID